MNSVRSFILSRPPPSINAQKLGVGGRLITAPDYRRWIRAAADELAPQPGFPAGDFLWRSEILFPCNHNKMDIDNAPKAIHDVLVKLGKVPDDRYLADSRIRWFPGDHVIVAIQQENFEKWSRIKQFSPSLTRRLARNSPSSPRLL